MRDCESLTLHQLHHQLYQSLRSFPSTVIRCVMHVTRVKETSRYQPRRN